MKYRDDEYGYENRRREADQRRRVRPDVEMTSQRRRNPAGAGTSGSYGTRGTADPYGARRTAQSASGARNTSASRNTGTRARNASAARTSAPASGRRIGADPYDRSYQAGRGKRPAASKEAAGKGKRPLSAKAKKKRRIRRILFAVEGILLLLVLGGLFVISKWDKRQKSTFAKKDIYVNELPENTIQSMEGYRTIAIFGADEEGSHSDVIMIANIDNKTGEVTLTSVLRDTYWNVPVISDKIED